MARALHLYPRCCCFPQQLKEQAELIYENSGAEVETSEHMRMAKGAAQEVDQRLKDAKNMALQKQEEQRAQAREERRARREEKRQVSVMR